jgi:hypothetical protein
MHMSATDHHMPTTSAPDTCRVVVCPRSERLGDDRDKFRSGKVLVVLPPGRVRADYALDIGKHIVRHFQFTLSDCYYYS